MKILPKILLAPMKDWVTEKERMECFFCGKEKEKAKDKLCRACELQHYGD